MSRRYRRETEIIPEHEASVIRTDITCDGCGRVISPDDKGEWHAHTVMVSVNSSEWDLDSIRHRRDYCTLCLDGRWPVICDAIAADPESDGSGFDDGMEEV